MILSLLQAPDFGLSIEAVLARQIPARTRSLIRVDPVEYELIQGTLKPEAPWEKRAITGWKAAPSGYVWFRIKSAKRQIFQLNINGASMAYVNGEPRVGDVYGYGAYYIPVAMKQGMNDILVYGFRGDATLNWRKPEAEIDLDRFDATLPDFNTDTKKAQGQWGGFVVHNNSERPRTVLLERRLQPASESETSVSQIIPPLGTIKIPVLIDDAPKTTITLREGSNIWATKTFTLQPRKTGEPYRRTFISAMDGSAQYYAVNPSSKPNPKVAVLSLHGASVEAIGQAQAYGQKDFCDIICPTNRRPFGFDWEGIGRKDALEVLADAQSKAKYDPSRIMLTGHSMGGHGTWHLGSNYPNLFAAIAPCSGWISWDTYTGGANYDLKDPVQKLLARANNPLNPLLLKESFAQYQGVYALHGEADDNVPATEARHMAEVLKGNANFTYNEVPGAGHWYDTTPEPGADCVDWKPFFDIFRTARKADPLAKGTIDFRTVDAGISNSFGIGKVMAQAVPFELTQVVGTRNDQGWDLKTENVARLTLSQPAMVDGQKLESGKGYFWKGKTWNLDLAPTLTPHGFASVYDNNVTIAPPIQYPELWPLIRFHLELLWYRANATPSVVPQTEAIPQNVLAYYGSTNGATTASFALTSRLGSQMGVIWCGGKEGWRFAARFPFLSPGIGMPDKFQAQLPMLQGKTQGTLEAHYYDAFGLN